MPFDAYNSYARADVSRRRLFRAAKRRIRRRLPGACGRPKPTGCYGATASRRIYSGGLRGIADTRGVHLLQATQPACMPTLNAATHGDANCRSLATQVEAYFGKTSRPRHHGCGLAGIRTRFALRGHDRRSRANHRDAQRQGHYGCPARACRPVSRAASLDADAHGTARGCAACRRIRAAENFHIRCTDEGGAAGAGKILDSFRLSMPSVRRGNVRSCWRTAFPSPGITHI